MAENPYESPATPSSPRMLRSSVGSILLLIGMVPAAATSCFAICFAGMQVAPTARNYGEVMQNFVISLAVGAIFGAAVFGTMLWWAIAPRRASREPRIWTYEDGTKVDACLVRCDEIEVLLRKADGVELRVPIALLCDGDRDWLTGQR